jgi:hypothetical protein
MRFRIAVLLGRAGWRVNVKCVRRLYNLEGLCATSLPKANLGMEEEPRKEYS